MLLIRVIVTFFGILSTSALKCVSVINQKFISSPKIIETNPEFGLFVSFLVIFEVFIYFYWYKKGKKVILTKSIIQVLEK